MPAEGSAAGPHAPWSGVDPVTRQNIRAETFFSASTASTWGWRFWRPRSSRSPVCGRSRSNHAHCGAFPVAFSSGPLWAGAGPSDRHAATSQRTWPSGQRPLFLISGSTESWQFTLLIRSARFLNSGMRMGQSSLYHLLYPKLIRGGCCWAAHLLDVITQWCRSILVAGWLLDISREM